MLVATESGFRNALENYGNQLYGFCCGRRFMKCVVHFGIQLPRFACIQAESNKNRIHTLGHAF